MTKSLIKDLPGAEEIGRERADRAVNQEVPMTCPRCKNDVEMVFSVFSHSFSCQEADCGLEVEMDCLDLEVLFQSEVELAVA